MKRLIKILLLLITLGALSSCGAEEGGIVNENPPAEEIGDNFVMKGIVTGISDKIEINVYEAEYAEGIYWIVIDKSTEIIDSSGNKISLSDVNAGEKIAVEYSGQVMMSYPPQVYAIKIKKQ